MLIKLHRKGRPKLVNTKYICFVEPEENEIETKMGYNSAVEMIEGDEEWFYVDETIDQILDLQRGIG